MTDIYSFFCIMKTEFEVKILAIDKDVIRKQLLAL
jgi:hypothetical protein